MDYFQNIPLREEITNILKKRNNRYFFSYKKDNYSTPFFHSIHNNRCSCECHEIPPKNLRRPINYNTEINSPTNLNIKNNNIRKTLNQNNISRNKSTNDLINYNYKNVNYITRNKNYNPKHYIRINNNNFCQNKKLNIIKTESNDNLIKSFVIYKNEVQPLYTEHITKRQKLNNHKVPSSRKYSYGGKILKIATNTNNHSYKETIGRANSRHKIFNKCRVINFIHNNDNSYIYHNNYDYDSKNKNSLISQNYDNGNDSNFGLYNESKNISILNNNNSNNIIGNNSDDITCKTEIKKSYSENYLSKNIDNSKKNLKKYINKSIKNDDYKDNHNFKCVNEKQKEILDEDIKYANNKYSNNQDNNNQKILMDDINMNKKEYLLKNNKENNLNKNYLFIDDEINNNYNNKKKENIKKNNYKYYYNYSNNKINNNQKGNIYNSSSVDNINYLMHYHSNTNCNSKNNFLEDFNYEDFKLKIKLGLLKKQIYKNDIHLRNNNNRITANIYIQDKKYLENVLNNNKKKFVIDNILSEKTKKLLEEKKTKKHTKLNNNNNKKNNVKINVQNKNENKILSSIMRNLVENNKKNNKYVVNPKLNFFKS